MSLFICPVCGGELERGEKEYRCENGHVFDVASSGYVNLLPANRKHSLSPGDDAEMARARRDFLSKGYYSPLLNELCGLVNEYSCIGARILDAGCGEGWYTHGIFKALSENGKAPRLAGTDISKLILKSAAKRGREIEFAVASSYRLPVADASLDLLLDCFSPLALDEFRRALRPGGAFLYVVPGERHLWELKEVLYDKPYINEEKVTPYEGFAYEKIVPVSADITLGGNEDILALFHMTPYCWKTPREGAERLKALDKLTTRIEFRIHVFRRDAQ